MFGVKFGGNGRFRTQGQAFPFLTDPIICSHIKVDEKHEISQFLTDFQTRFFFFFKLEVDLMTWNKTEPILS